MATIEIDLSGLKPTQEALARAPEIIKRELLRGMTEAVLFLWQTMPGYPPLPAKRAERMKRGWDKGRTGRLGRSAWGKAEGGGFVEPWITSGIEGAVGEVTPIVGGVRGVVGSGLEYSPFVIGEDQAQHMRHWWRLLPTVLGKTQRWMLFFHRAAQRIAEQIIGLSKGG